MVIPPGEVKLIPTAAAAPTGFERYLTLIRLKITNIMINGARLSTAKMRDQAPDFVTTG